MSGKLYIITGGSGSGKSAYAETEALRLASSCPGNLYYIATMEPFGDEAEKRIQKHRRMRKGKGFTTIECYVDLHLSVSRLDGEHNVVLLEDLGNLVANEMYRKAGTCRQTADFILEGIRELLSFCDHLLVVTNEVFSDGMDYPEETEAYLAALSETNRRLVLFSADTMVTEVIYGISVEVKR